MKSKQPENDRDIKTGTIYEKETVCDRSVSNSVFEKSIVIKKTEDENILEFIVLNFLELEFPQTAVKK